MKNRCKFAMRKRRPQNALKNGFGRVLGSIWEGVGTVWAVFWTLLGCFFGILNPNFCKHRSRMGSKRPFGSILDGFWEVLGGLWMDFGRFWEGSGKIFYVRTPALSREAPRSVPMRGGPRPPSVLNGTSPTSLLNLPWEGLRPLLRRLRVSRRRFWGQALLEGSWAIFLHLFAFFSVFLLILSKHRIFDQYFSMFYRFWEDFGWIWKGFCDAFQRFF